MSVVVVLRNLGLPSGRLVRSAAILVLVVSPIVALFTRAESIALTNKWSSELSFLSESSPAIGDDGAIYLGTWNGEFRAYRPDGSTKWIFHGGREIKSSPAIGADGTIYFGSRDRKLYAITAEGRKKWEFKTGGWVDSSPAIGFRGDIYFGSWDKNFYAVSPGGLKQWEFRTTGEVVSSPAVGLDGQIYFGSHDGKFYALGPHGDKVWEFATAGPIISSPAIDRDGTLYFTSVNGHFYALDSSGKLKWLVRTGGITESSPVIGQDGTIYTGANNTLWAIGSDGKNKWEQPYGTALIEASPLALLDDTVCFVSSVGTLINLGSPNRFNWTYDQKGYGKVSPAISHDGVIYTMEQKVGTGILLCALPIDGGLARSAWPKFRADAHNTGRQNSQMTVH